MFKSVLPAMLLLPALSLFGSTAGPSACSNGTVASYESSYAPPSLGCSIGVLDYSNFSYRALQNAPTASELAIMPGSSSANGFNFSLVSGAPVVADGDVVQFAIYYNIFIDPAPVIPGAHSHLDPPVGNVNITEYFCNDSILYPGTKSCFPPTSPAYALTVTTASPDGSIVFNTPATQYETVGIVFTLDGTKGLASFDGFTTDTTVTTTPEPASIGLVGLFLLAGSYQLKKRCA